MLDKMFELVKSVNKNSYSPYSNYKVSACIHTNDDKFITGVNVENASYGLSMCAERSALFKAISLGYKPGDFDKIMIYTNRTDSIPYPCGACLQVISELMGLDKDIIVVNDNKNYEIHKVKEMLPFAFTKESL